MITRKTTRPWFQLPEGTEVFVTGESTDTYPGQPVYRTMVIRRADGQKIVGPDGPKNEVGVAEHYLDGDPVPRMARDLTLGQMLDLE